MQEILVILVLALIFLGPKKLPELASGIGKAIREVRKATADIKSEIELDDIIRKPLEELREATMLPPEELKRRDEERKWRADREKEEKKQAKLDQEARDRGEIVPGDEVHASGDDYHDTAHDADDYHEPGDGYDGHEGEHAGEHAGEHEDPQSHSPGTGGLPRAANVDVPTGELTIGDLEPVQPPGPGKGASPSSRPPSRAMTPPLPPTAVGDKTIAMTMPPPMEGAARSTLPPPRPAATPAIPPRSTPAFGTPQQGKLGGKLATTTPATTTPATTPATTTPATTSATAVPAVGDKTIIEPLKAATPAGAVPRPNTQTLFGVTAPKVPPAAAPALAGTAPVPAAPGKPAPAAPAKPAANQPSGPVTPAASKPTPPAKKS
jgi:TatA/E family protein of Tat protein translocase